MGHAIEALAKSRGHEVGATIDNEQEWAERQEMLTACDVAVEFSQPSTAVANIRKCFALGLPVVVGTTGWYDLLATLKEECLSQSRSLFVASNFSIGMNIMFTLNKRLASLMNSRPEYEVGITETHHIHKLDAPSGTAITLAQDAIALLDRKAVWALDAPAPETLSIHSIREGEVPGTHTVTYDGPHDTLTLAHTAHGREGLALGAVLACEFLMGKVGFYTMEDLLG